MQRLLFGVLALSVGLQAATIGPGQTYAYVVDRMLEENSLVKFFLWGMEDGELEISYQSPLALWEGPSNRKEWRDGQPVTLNGYLHQAVSERFGGPGGEILVTNIGPDVFEYVDATVSIRHASGSNGFLPQRYEVLTQVSDDGGMVENPEPGTWAMLVSGLIYLQYRRKRAKV